MSTAPFTTPLAEYVWHSRYRYTDGNGRAESDLYATWDRVAKALASVESSERDRWQRQFADLLADFKFLPGGRILAGAGTGRQVTLANCFVMGAIADSMDGIFTALKEGALTMQAGGGVGYDFSTLRPNGSPATSTGNSASGPVAFMNLWEAMCATVSTTGARRGAMMAVLRCDHPDIGEFLRAKAEPGRLAHFNLSVAVTDALMHAVDTDADWPLTFAAHGTGAQVHAHAPARALWQALIQAAFAQSEPGVLFIDRINRTNNLRYCEEIRATNPCGEAPLPAYGACHLGSFNLAAYVRAPFTDKSNFDLDALVDAVSVAVRLLDNVIDLSYYPLPAQAQQASATRRLGLGITGLADALIMQGLAYDSDAGRGFASSVMQSLQEAAYAASIRIARDKGSFPLLDASRFLAAPGPAALPAALRADIERTGLRNSHLTAVAPAGSISLLANNVSSGIEPVFSSHATRTVRSRAGELERFDVEDYAHLAHRQALPEAGPPPAFVVARDLSPEAHLGMQAAVQRHVDQAVAKTINLPDDIPQATFEGIFRRANELELKGCTTFRQASAPSAVLSSRSPT